jgi:two-component system, OmpR family, response regulator MtrA
MRKAILVVEDDAALARVLSDSLTYEGFDVECVREGHAAVERARRQAPDLILLDIGLPDTDGFAIVELLRQSGPTPIIVLTARGQKADKLRGLKLGADDYVTKPFSLVELVSRVRAILRRRELDRAGRGYGFKRIGSLTLDLVRHKVSLDGTEVRLTPSEFRLLALLAEEPERVYSRRQIMQHLWESSYVGDERACDIHISNLRRKLENEPEEPERIVTVRGVGYKLVPV